MTFTVLLTQGMGIAGYAAAVAASPVVAALPFAKKLGLLRVVWGSLGEPGGEEGGEGDHRGEEGVHDFAQW